MADTPMSGLPALPGIPLPALPPLSSPAPSSSSATPQPPPTNKRPTPNTPDTTDGPPKRKRVRKSAASAAGGGTPGETTPGPGKNWRKGLKGNLAGVGLEGAMAAAAREGSTKPATPSAAAKPAASSPAPPPVPLPPLVPFNPTGRTASHLVGAPPKLATQFLPPQILEPGAPRPRRWARAKMEFRNITGGTITLTAWQGDSYSSYTEHLNRNSIDELASPPPPNRFPLPGPASSGPKPSLSRTPQQQQHHQAQSTPIAGGAQPQSHSRPQAFTPYPVPSPLSQPPPSVPTYQSSSLAPPTIPPFNNQPPQSSPSHSQSPSASSTSTNGVPKPSASPLAPPTYPSFPTSISPRITPTGSTEGGSGGNAEPPK
ncbi:hypothetical protein JCM3765_004203 [Sporobolomyces pararoseus]